MSLHWCNQVVDPGTCCPVAHGAPESECNCSNFYRVTRSLPGAIAEGYFTEMVKWFKQNPNREYVTGDWEKIMQRWDAYQIGQMWGASNGA